MKRLSHQRGFSLVELAIVLLIMGLVIGGLAMPMAVQRDNARVRDAQQQLQSVQTAITGFALVNGYLPCPATPSSDGYAALSGTDCSVQHGFVPATTLNIDGARNDDNLVLDPWGSPLRYSVTASDADGDGRWDFTTAGQMRSVTMPLLQPNLVICSTSAGATSAACSGTGVTLSDQSPVVLYSLGKDWASFASADQQENVGAMLGGGVSGRNYPVAANRVFVNRSRSERSGSEFDDLVVWMSAHSLYSQLVDAGHLP
jgi:prepilin-type N-terminal cleavage/methylation domain-containing protein